jgi:hypothetical protein
VTKTMHPPVVEACPHCGAPGERIVGRIFRHRPCGAWWIAGTRLRWVP